MNRSRFTLIYTQINADNMVNDFLCQEETYQIRGACFEVYNKLGGAFKEKVIENALYEELISRGLVVERQKRIVVQFKGKTVGIYTPDLIVGSKILIELKCKPFLTKEDDRQFWLYLRGTDYKLGLLINFGPKKLEVKRRIYDKARYKTSA